MTISYSGLGKQGRLGNQLFQIAATIALAKKHGHEAAFPDWPYERYFKNPLPHKGFHPEGSKLVQEPHFHFAELILDKGCNTDLVGYFQSEKYFEEYANDIREQFDFDANGWVSEMFFKAQDMIGQYEWFIHYCAIHVRRGDYLTNNAFRVLGIDYYEAAIQKIEAHRHAEGKPPMKFLIFSDDIQWCKEHFKGDKFIFSEGRTDIEDLALMAQCKHFIISASSFSWWGAWLGEREGSVVVAPDKWFGAGMVNANTQDVIPERWIKIPAEPQPRVYKHKLQLPQVTLVAMACTRVEATVKALEYSMRGIEFGAIKLISDKDGIASFLAMTEEGSAMTTHEIEKTKSLDDWCRKVIYELPKFIDTEYCLLVHSDGFVVNPEMWRPEFLDYDYIGAPWPSHNHPVWYRDIHGEEIRQGNSVSLRSKRLLDLANQLNLPWEKQRDGYFHEDTFICVHNRHKYVEAGMRFAGLEVAKYFSHETMIPEVAGIRPFCFHKWHGSNAQYPRFEEN